jgi:amidase
MVGITPMRPSGFIFPRDSWREIANDKRNEREENLSKFREWRLTIKLDSSTKNVTNIARSEMNEKEWEIINYDATALVDVVKQRKFTCLEVVQATCHAATIAQDLTNCLTEVFFDEALDRARELDKYISENGKPFGPLHGLPVSIKDHIKVNGKDTATGYVAWCYKTIAEEDAVAVDILRKAGAIIYAKTNNPQTLLVCEYDSSQEL